MSLMRYASLSLVTMIWTNLLAMAPVLSADSTTTGQDTPQPNNSVQSKKNSASSVVALPKSMAGFCAGLVIGTPICFIRKFPQEVREGAHGFVGSLGKNDSKSILYVPACAVWLPIAACVTALESPAYALDHAYTAEQPFSKEQFSLGKMEP